MNYYNENDPDAAHWLRCLMEAGLIPEGIVDERSISDIFDLASADQGVAGHLQVHLFAGIGGWSEALRIAGWPEDRPVWTGSCPCQPFSAAGKGKGTADKRHLWPEMLRLIKECRPPTIFGEQVASRAGRDWLAGVRADLEALGYAVGAADLCAASVGAPHIRQRLYWVADAGCERRQQECRGTSCDEGENGRQSNGNHIAASHRKDSRLADAEDSDRRSGVSGAQAGARKEVERRRGSSGGCVCGGMGDADDPRPQGRRVLPERADELSPWASSLDCWIPCADGKARRIAPGITVLAHGVQGRVAQLRGLGNAIVPQVAAAFIKVYMKTKEGQQQ